MARWIVFDEVTATELRAQLPSGAVFEAPGRTAVEYALTTSRTVIAVLEPAVSNDSKATIAVFRPKRRVVAQPNVSLPVPDPAAGHDSPPAREANPVRASGFLGLSDSLVAPEEEEVVTRKRWWQFWR